MLQQLKFNYFCKKTAMPRNRRSFPILEKVKIIDAGSEGKAIARVENQVIFVPFVVPGDVIDIRITKSRKSYKEGKAVKFHKYSDLRIEPKCSHFGVCGGCKWQNLSYEQQLVYKQKQVKDSLERIAKVEFPEISPILPAEDIFYYRNKLEYSFSNRKWLSQFSKEDDHSNTNFNGVGFHIPGIFDKIVDIEHCYLQAEPSNKIRLAVKDYAIKNNLTFYNVRKWVGFMRNLVIRTSNTGDLMVIMVVGEPDRERIHGLMDFIKEQFPEITSLFYVVNGKQNDDISDQTFVHFHGKQLNTEKMTPALAPETNLEFRIGPISFFQTNSEQANNLYNLAAEFAGFKGHETVYDLYTGTGTIANFIAGSVKKVIGLEYVPSAVEDAKKNAKLNNIKNTSFYAGTIEKVLNNEFVQKNGKPEIVISDPPRAGMHQKVIDQLNEVLPKKIVYISCNPATQARDIALLDENYKVTKVKPVDMFPHTHHVENIVLLEKRMKLN